MHVAILAYNLIWWAILGVQVITKQREIRRIVGEKDNETEEKRKGQNMKGTHILGGCHAGAICTTKLGRNLRVWN